MIPLRCTFVFIVIAMLATPASAATTPVDLSSWSPTTLDLGGQPIGSWELLDANTTAWQKTNAAPTFYLNGVDQTDFSIDGTWRVGSTTDDDFIGFTFGYQDPAHCYVMDWKSHDQSHLDFGTAREGFRIFKIGAPDAGSLSFTDFWTELDTANKTVLASEYGPGIGWVQGVEYTFELVFTPGAFTVTVTQDETVLWEQTVFDATYTSGQFGFYNCSQDDVFYSGFVQNDFPVCDAGGPYFGSAGQPVLFDGSGSFDPDGELVAWEWDFGDGATGAGETPTHVYAADGEYQVTLCVVDDAGVRECCAAPLPTVPNETSTFGALKARF